MMADACIDRAANERARCRPYSLNSFTPLLGQVTDDPPPPFTPADLDSGATSLIWG
jgi:hypothetical protein